MKLTDEICRTATCPPTKRCVRLQDGKNLYFQVTPKGTRTWWVKFYFEGKDRRLLLGEYPDLTLELARQGRNRALQLLVLGINPIAVKRGETSLAQLGEDAFAPGEHKTAAASRTIKDRLGISVGELEALLAVITAPEMAMLNTLLKNCAERLK